MGVVWSRESAKGRSVSGKRSDGSTYRREFLVRTDSPDTSLLLISNAPGLNYGDAHPDDASVFLDSYDCKPVDDSGMLYLLSVEYRKQSAEDGDGGGGEPGGGFEFRIPIWSGSSSVVTRPIYKDKDDATICNSANDPLEDLEAEQAEEHLSVVQYYALHTAWMTLARTYTNAINSATWNGGAPQTWKCQGCSKKLQSENKFGTTIVFWEITWEFAYKADKWTLKPWDIGFAQLVDDEGVPSGAATKRALIKGQDGKPVRQPVALAGGVALPAGSPPVALEFLIYQELDFHPVFGELYTPGAFG